MGYLVRFTSPRHAEIIDQPDVEPGPGEVLITTRYSGISAGTELTAYRGTNPYLSHRWDADTRLFVEGEPTHSYPLDGWGYEEVGEISSVGAGVDAALVGRLVWGAWGHRSTAIRTAEWAEHRMMPGANDDVVGIFAKIGAIALNAVLDADLHVGETVAVFGAGVPGQIVAQLARLNGARVVVIDLVEQRRDLAMALGAHEALDPRVTDVATRLKQLTDGRGADVAIEISGSYQALHDAVRSVAYSSRVVAAGFYQGGGTPIRLGEEFHHNRVSVVGSQISGVAPALQHRWDEIRMSQTVLELESSGSLQLAPLVSHTVAARDAVGAFEMLDSADSDVMQVVLDYRA